MFHSSFSTPSIHSNLLFKLTELESLGIKVPPDLLFNEAYCDNQKKKIQDQQEKKTNNKTNKNFVNPIQNEQNTNHLQNKQRKSEVNKNLKLSYLDKNNSYDSKGSTPMITKKKHKIQKKRKQITQIMKRRNQYLKTVLGDYRKQEEKIYSPMQLQRMRRRNQFSKQEKIFAFKIPQNKTQNIFFHKSFSQDFY
ncbi:hypothetical protein M0813_15532 [Anaeramoeba flamelloides]|uniref:Uncharacterized protein n=1 Tax=Anaeramoeba flamelloides TaxID=1746091 RepID=A0ABQ8Z1N6_9EUKA|nr:hypothetical protein M0813_15532 [Anaeramoeba flamelloides]